MRFLGPACCLTRPFDDLALQIIKSRAPNTGRDVTNPNRPTRDTRIAGTLDRSVEAAASTDGQQAPSELGVSRVSRADDRRTVATPSYRGEMTESDGFVKPSAVLRTFATISLMSLHRQGATFRSVHSSVRI